MRIFMAKHIVETFHVQLMFRHLTRVAGRLFEQFYNCAHQFQLSLVFSLFHCFRDFYTQHHELFFLLKIACISSLFLHTNRIFKFSSMSNISPMTTISFNVIIKSIKQIFCIFMGTQIVFINIIN